MNKIVVILAFSIMLSSCMKKTEETKPVRKDMTETVFASGILEANNTYILTSLSDGYIVNLPVKENDIIKEGQQLAIIDNKQNLYNSESAEALYTISRKNVLPGSPILGQAQKTVEVAKQKMLFDSIQNARYKKLFHANSVSKSDYENISLQYTTSKTSYLSSLDNYKQQKQQTNQQLIINKAQRNVNTALSNYNQLRAIYPGRVYEIFKQKGDFVKKGDAIARIGDANFMYAKVNIDENSIRKVKLGQDAVIQLNIDSRKTYHGKVAEILPSFNEQSQSFTCKIFFNDTLDFKFANTQLQANIITCYYKNTLVIPRNFLHFGNQVNIKGNRLPVKVETGIVSSDWVQIIAGIDENTTLVTDKILKK